MQDVLENTGNTASVPQRSGLMSTIFREYRNHFGLFWRVMLPLIVFSLIFWFLFFKFGAPETAQWTFSTSTGIKAVPSAVSDHSSETSQPSPKPTNVKAIDGSATHIGFLWLAMCPLALIIVHYHRGVAVPSREAWLKPRPKIWHILSGCALIGAFLLCIGAIVVLLLMLLLEDGTFIGFSGSIFLFVLLPSIPITYFLVKWSLYNQCIIIENLSVIAAFRRSSALVRGAWGRFFSMYLLLVLGTTVFRIAVLGLTLLLFSAAAPEFVLLREVLLSGKFVGLFFGNHVQITLQQVPIWAIAAMVTVYTLTNAVLAPIWALLTTHLYMERAGTQ